jgi:hypothetical protein
MSDPIASQSPAGEENAAEPAEPLQFDQAEFETPAADRPTCAVCHQPIAEEYYEINGKVMCPNCRHGVEAAFRGGSGLARFVKATIFGTAAALVGSVIYYAFIKATNANWALISILVGFMIGSAVRKGTGNRGGRVYQLLAVFLTYSSIVAMHLPFLVEAFQKRQPPRPAVPEKAMAGKRDPAGAEAKAPVKATEGARPQEPGARPAPAGGPGEEVAAGPGQPVADDEQAGEQQGPPAAPPTLSGLLLILATLVGYLYFIPIMVAKNAPISGLIYAFALWEAWKLNRPVQLVFNGPFRLAEAGPAEPKPEGIDDGA